MDVQRVLDIVRGEFIGGSDEYFRRNYPTFVAEITAACGGGGDVEEKTFKVNRPKLIGLLQGRLAEVEKPWAAEKDALAAELASAADYPAALVAWHQAVIDGLADGTFKVDEDGDVYAVSLDRPVPLRPRKVDERDVRDREERRAKAQDVATQSLRSTIGMLGISDEDEVEVSVNDYQTYTQGAVPAVRY